jgi:hypothetical protein
LKIADARRGVSLAPGLDEETSGMRVRMCAVAMVVLSNVCAAWAATPDRAPVLTIRIHDYANVDPQELQRAQQQVSETYAQAGVRLQWRAPAHPAEVSAGHASWPRDGEPLFTVIMLARGMAPHPMPSGVAGYAPITRERGGRLAFVFADRTLAIARRAAVSYSSVLSAVIAHELAHLLMPQRSHAANGLMRPNWSPDEFRWAAKQRFTVDESRAIRDMAGSLAGGGDGHTKVAD